MLFLSFHDVWAGGLVGTLVLTDDAVLMERKRITLPDFGLAARASDRNMDVMVRHLVRISAVSEPAFL